jgi:hypothetical protein
VAVAATMAAEAVVEEAGAEVLRMAVVNQLQAIAQGSF